MSGTVFAAVPFAALLRASWNALASIVNVPTPLPVVLRRDPGVLGRTLAHPGRVLLAGAVTLRIVRRARHACG